MPHGFPFASISSIDRASIESQSRGKMTSSWQKTRISPPARLHARLSAAGAEYDPLTLSMGSRASGAPSGLSASMEARARAYFAGSATQVMKVTAREGGGG